MPLAWMSSSNYNDLNSVYSYENLSNWIKQYESILTPAMIEYLNSLINLEFSVVKDYISEKDRILLSELSIYDKVAIFNIYNRALNLFKRSDDRIQVQDNNEHVAGINVFTNEDPRQRLFEYDYNGTKSIKVPPCGKVVITQYLNGEEEKKKEIERYKRKISLSSPGDLGPSKDIEGNDLVGANSLRVLNYITELEASREQLRKLIASELTEEDSKRIELSNEFHDLLLEDYGLTEDDFKPMFKDSINNIVNKTEVKKLKLSIIRDTRYI